MANWEIKTINNDSIEEDEEEQTNEEESEPLENIISESSRFNPIFNFNKSETTPFLESGPIENLEQDLQQTSNENENKTPELEQPMLYNAPSYSGSYESGEYENTRKNADTQMDISGGSLMTRENTLRESAMHMGDQRRMDLNAWQKQNMDQFDSQSEKYQVGKAEKLKQKDDLPFQ